MKEVFSSTWTLPLLLICSTAYSESGSEAHHQHGAHVHGEAILNVVLEAQLVIVELQTPAANILGFEHQPSTAEQHHAVDQAMLLLKDFSNVFQFEAGACRQTTVDIDEPYADNDKHHTDSDHQHDHAHHHDKHDSHTDEQDSHSEFHVLYHLACSEPDDIASIGVRVFDYFPGFETVRVQWVGINGQGMMKVSDGKTKIGLRP